MDLIAGGVAGALSKSCVAPLERVKILFQTGSVTNTGIGQTLLNISRKEGLQGWYRGNGASVLRVVPYAAFHFAAYEQYRNIIAKHVYGVNDVAGKQMPPTLDLLAGSAAGATAVLLTYPLDLVRTKLAYDPGTGGQKSAEAIRDRPVHYNRPDRKEAVQLQERTSNNGAASPRTGTLGTGGQQQVSVARSTMKSVLKQSWQTEGFKGLYRGIGPTLLGILPYAGLKFYIYQSLKQRYWTLANPPGTTLDPRESKPPIALRLTFGGVAGVVAQTFTYPLDVVRRGMQVRSLQSGANLNTWTSLKALVNQKGVRGLFTGLSINYLKVVPTTAIGFTVYDAMKGYLGLPQNL